MKLYYDFITKHLFTFCSGAIHVLLFFLPFGPNYDVLISLIYFLITQISLQAIFFDIDRMPFSLNKIYWYFQYLFFGLAPFLQFKFNITFWEAKHLDVQNYWFSGLIILGSLILYYLVYHYLYNFFLKGTSIIARKELFIKEKMFVLIGVFSSILFLITIRFNLVFLFKKNFLRYNKSGLFNALNYSLYLISRNIPTVLVFYYLAISETRKYLFYLLAILLLINFPTAISRGNVAIIYLPLLVILVPVFKKKNIFSYFFIGAFLIVFPLLNFFRNGRVEDIILGIDFFLSPHTDAFHNFTHLIENKIVVGGKQLLGSLLFFLPDMENFPKINGTGHLLSELQGFSYKNIAMPFLGEGYVNFGYFGIVLAIIIVSSFNAFMDVKFKNGTMSSRLLVFYYFFIGFEFYLLRGDLYSSINKIVTFILAFLLVILFLNLGKKFSNWSG